MNHALIIFVGAGVGGLLRYWIGGAIQNASGGAFPLGTLVVNVSGCLAIGFLAAAFTGPWLVREEVRQGIIIGVLGGYTTFSSFGRETLALLQDRQWLAAGANVLLSNLLGLMAVWIGWMLAGKLLGGGDGI
jgi:CrcB protein